MISPVGIILVLAGCYLAYIVEKFSRDSTPSWSIILAGMAAGTVIGLGLSIRVLGC